MHRFAPPSAATRLRAMAPLTLWLASSACGDKGSDSATPDGDGDLDSGWTSPEGGVVHLQTRDGVTLEGDYYPASAPGRPGVVLLHMIPPGNDRTNWPEAFIAELAAHDWAVINIDRRGAGNSEGDATDAYEGELGRYDTEAAVTRLTTDGYGPVGIMGASNGTTSMIDYAAWAPGEGLPVPAVLGFLTGGTYTEAQTSMEEVVDLPCVFTYQTSENAWSEEQRALDPGDWEFHEYPGAGHGTQMLTSSDGDAVTAALVDYFSAAFGD